MQPVKLGGLTLKSEEKKEEVEEIVDAASEGLEVPEPEEDILDSGEGILDGLKDEDETPEHEPTLMEELTSIIKRVEEWPRDDNTIKAIGKLKGALQLLS